jgi:hypothetical protein
MPTQHRKDRRRSFRPFTIAALALVLSGCQSGAGLGSMVSGGASLFQQVGGMNTVTQLATLFLQSSGKDPQLSSLFKGADQSKLSGQLANQLCATLGGGCAAPLTNEQISAGAKMLSGAQNQAIASNLDTALSSAVSSPAVRQAADNVLGPQISGILGALL